MGMYPHRMNIQSRNRVPFNPTLYAATDTVEQEKGFELARSWNFHYLPTGLHQETQQPHQPNR